VVKMNKPSDLIPVLEGVDYKTKKKIVINMRRDKKEKLDSMLDEAGKELEEKYGKNWYEIMMKKLHGD
jgi:hypothetical protein